MGLTVIFTILIVSIYATIILLLTYGLNKLSKEFTEEESSRQSDEKIPQKVSLVIPFRNEKAHLADLAGDLKNQTYPGELMQIIFVNDHSEDESSALIQQLVEDDHRFEILQLDQSLTGKKHALAMGISQAGSDWILQIDADCRLGINFVSDHMQYISDHPVELVAGLVTTSELGGRFTENFERLDLLSLIGSGAGSFFFGRPLMCNGSNLLYTRELYEATRRFDPTNKVSSGDDMFLMIGARKLGRKMAFNASKSCLVFTTPVQHFRDLILSRIRWGSKSVHYGMFDIQALAIVVVLTHVLLMFSFIGLFWIPEFWYLVLGAWVLKAVTDFSMLYKISRIVNQRKALRWFLPVAVSYSFVQLIIFGGTLLLRPRWKGRTR